MSTRSSSTLSHGGGQPSWALGQAVMGPPMESERTTMGEGHLGKWRVKTTPIPHRPLFQHDLLMLNSFPLTGDSRKQSGRLIKRGALRTVATMLPAQERRIHEARVGHGPCALCVKSWLS